MKRMPDCPHKKEIKEIGDRNPVLVAGTPDSDRYIALTRECAYTCAHGFWKSTFIDKKYWEQVEALDPKDPQYEKKKSDILEIANKGGKLAK